MLRLSRKDAQRLGICAGPAAARNGKVKPPNGLGEQRRPNKMGAVKTELDGILFDSGREARRYAVLLIERRLGLISGLQLQTEFRLSVEGKKVCSYFADFVYVRHGRGLVVEDAKGYRTPEYRLKRKLMKAVYAIEISEV